MADVVIVTPNPAIDVTYRVDDQTPGETHRVREISRRPGGKGINVARGLEALGHSTVSVLPLGGSSGAWISDALTDLGLAHSVTPIQGFTRTTVTVTESNATAHPTVYSEAGPTIAPAEWQALVADTGRALVGSRMLVISGSLPPATNTDLIRNLVAAAHNAGVPVIVDASGEALLAAAAAGADVVKPNQQELLEATGAHSPDAAIAQLMEAGARTVVVSRGVDGIVASMAVAEAPGTTGVFAAADATSTPAASATASAASTVSSGIELRRYAVPAIAGVHGNPTGAGDAATAGLAAALLDGHPLEVALTWAAALGAAAVLKPVAGEVDIDAFQRFLAATTSATPTTCTSTTPTTPATSTTPTTSTPPTPPTATSPASTTTD